MSTSWLPIAGTYSSTTISMKGSQKLGDETMNITFKVRKH